MKLKTGWKMKHAALFNGIGGFQLAAEWMGWENVMSCEIDEICTSVTKHYYPNCITHGDITKTDFSVYRGRIDILTCGFPCQPFSVAGKRKGTADHRHLWPEAIRAIREIAPVWIVGENVPGIANWDGGLVFDQVCTDLENEGYEVIPFNLPAAGVNAPHKRERIWFIAYSDSSTGKQGDVAHTNNDRLQGRGEGNIRLCNKTCRIKTEIRSCSFESWQNFPTQPPICNGNDGVSAELVRIYVTENSGGILTEKEIDTLVQKTISRYRKKAIKAGGNAIVPQVALQIFKAIEQFNNK